MNDIIGVGISFVNRSENANIIRPAYFLEDLIEFITTFGDVESSDTIQVWTVQKNLDHVCGGYRCVY